MKKIVLLSVAGMMVLSGFAQKRMQNKSPEEIAAFVSKRMEKNLGINADQKQKVYDLTLNKIKQVREVKANKAEDKEKRKDELKKIRDEYNDGMKDILTPEQFKQWTENKEKAKERAKKKRQHKAETADQDDEVIQVLTE